MFLWAITGSIIDTVNRLYHDIRYNSTILIKSIRSAQKSAYHVYFFTESPMLFFRKIYDLDICKTRLAEAIQTNTQNV